MSVQFAAERCLLVSAACRSGTFAGRSLGTRTGRARSTRSGVPDPLVVHEGADGSVTGHRLSVISEVTGVPPALEDFDDQGFFGLRNPEFEVFRVGRIHRNYWARHCELHVTAAEIGLRVWLILGGKESNQVFAFRL